MHQHASIIFLRLNFDETPHDGDDVIALALLRPQITNSRAVAMNHAIRHAPRFHRISVVSHAKRPAIEIRAVKKFNMICRRDCFLRGNNIGK